jgi:hypothetical protein
MLFLEERFWGFASFWQSYISSSFVQEYGREEEYALGIGRVALFEDSTFLASLQDLGLRSRLSVLPPVLQVLRAICQLRPDYSAERHTFLSFSS